MVTQATSHPTLQNAKRVSSEVSVYTVTRNIKLHKWLIIISVISCTLLAFAYTQLKTTQYVAEAEISPIATQHLENYNLANRIVESIIYENKIALEPKPLEPKEVYAELYKDLTSLTITEEFFDQFYLPSLSPEERQASPQHNLKQLHNQLHVRELGLLKPDTLKVEFEHQDVQQAQDLLKSFVDLANNKTVSTLNQQLSARVAAAQKQVQLQIDSIRTTAEQERKYQIERLTAALEIAEQIGLRKPTDDGSVLVNFDDKNLYLKGSDALKAELNILHQRKDNDAHIKGLDLLLDKQTMLMNLPSDITISSAAKFEANRLTKTKGVSDTLTIILGGLIGLLISLFYIIARSPRE